jgi:sugar phosphate isomerase/epimerase
MKIGMLTGLWHVAERASVVASLERAAALGFHYVDLHGVFHAGPAHLSPAERQAVGRTLERLNLVPRNYVLHARHNIPGASDREAEDDLAYLTEGMDLASSWGIPQIMLNAGQWVPGLSRQAAWSRGVDFLRRVCDAAQDREMYIAQEPEPYVWFLVSDLAGAARMAADVDRPNFSTLVDMGHMALARESAGDMLPVARTILHAHFSDHLPAQHTNQVIGTGFTPTAMYLEALRRLEAEGMFNRFRFGELVVSFELGAPGDTITDPDSWVRQSLEHVHQIAPYMSQ